MNKITLTLGVLIFAVNVIYADLGNSHRPYVAASWSGTFYFEMLPPAPTSDKMPATFGKQLGWGKTYRLNRDGSSDELWKIEGWYSSTVFLSEDAIHLVRLETENENNESIGSNLAIAFYSKEVLLRKYSVSELVKNQAKILKSVSHYKWLSSDIEHINKVLGNVQIGKSTVLPSLSLDNTFTLETCDGIVYIFDISTGEVKSRREA